MNELSKLLSGRQIRLHAGRIAKGYQERDEEQDKRGRRGGQPKQSKKVEIVGDVNEEQLLKDGEKEEEDLEEEEEEEEEEDEEQNAGHSQDMMEEDEEAVSSYNHRSASRPTWTGGIASPPEALAYLSTKAVPNYSINLRVLREVAQHFAGGEEEEESGPRSMLDVGCGPGSGLFAAQSIWPNMAKMEVCIVESLGDG